MPVKKVSVLKTVDCTQTGDVHGVAETVVNYVLCSGRLFMIQSFQSFVLHSLQHQETNQTDENKGLTHDRCLGTPLK